MTTQAVALREAIIARVTALGDYARVRRTPPIPINPAELPVFSVWIDAETLVPDGDENVGPLQFVNDVTIMLSDVRGFSDPLSLDGKIDAQIDRIEAALFTDPDFTRFDAEEGLFESVERIVRRRYFPQDGETYFAELRTAITFRTRTAFEPVIPDDLNGVDVTARPAGASERTPAIGIRINLPRQP